MLILQSAIFVILLAISSISCTEIVNASGMYQVQSNVVNTGDMYMITTSNVIFDLGGQVISGGSRGIVINQNLANITIQNGTISNLTGTGIVVAQGCTNIIISNVHTFSCDVNAIAFQGTVSVGGGTIDDCIIINCLFDNCCTGTASNFVCTFSDCTNTRIEQCSITANGNKLHNLTGIRLMNCDRMNLVSNNINNNSAINFIGVDINGGSMENVLSLCTARQNDVVTSQTLFYLNGALNQNNLLDQCAVIQNSNGNIAGIAVGNAISNICSACLVYGNTTTSAVSGYRITGTDCVFLNCVASDNSTTINPAIGFELLSGSIRIVLDSCKATNNSATGATAFANCFGFNLDQVTFCKLVNCYAFSNRSPGASTSIAAGFNVSTSGAAGTGNKNCEFNTCTATFNNASTDALSFGFRALSATNGNVNNLYVRCYAALNGPSTPVQTNQIVSTAGTGSNVGGVPSGAITSSTLTTLASITNGIITNIRIG